MPAAVSDRRLGVDPVEQAAGDGRRRRLDAAAGEDRVEGVAQVMVLGGRLAGPDAVLVVDRPPVADHRQAVEDDDLAGPLDQGHVGDHVALVLEDGERQAVLLGVRGDLLRPSRGRWR